MNFCISPCRIFKPNNSYNSAPCLLKSILPNSKIGLYRDNGLIALEKKLSNVEIEKIKKNMHKLTKSICIFHD